MRLLYINSAREWGGAEHWSRELFGGLADRRHQITFVCHPASELFARLADETRFSVVPVRIRGDTDPFRVAQLADLIRRRRPNLTVAYRFRDVKLAAAACWLNRRAPLVHTHKAPYPLKDSWDFRLIWTAGVRAVSVPAKAMRALLLERTPWLAKKPIYVIPNGVDTDRFRRRPELRQEVRHELGIAPDAFLISYHGRIEARKRIDALIRGAADAASTTPIHVLIIGGGPQLEELRQLARDLRAPVSFAGFRTDVPRLLSAADASAHLSTAEGMPNSVLEAMASGLPVIASDATSHAEQIEHGTHGYLVPAGEVDAVADAIQRLARDQEERERMGRNALRRATEQFRNGLMLDGYESFFQEFAETKTA